PNRSPMLKPLVAVHEPPLRLTVPAPLDPTALAPEFVTIPPLCTVRVPVPPVPTNRLLAVQVEPVTVTVPVPPVLVPMKAFWVCVTVAPPWMSKDPTPPNPTYNVPFPVMRVPPFT